VAKSRADNDSESDRMWRAARNATHLDIRRYIDRERDILYRCSVRDVLSGVVSSSTGRRAFAERFYFVRVGFVRHNFIIGARCPYSETYWGPLVKNLTEELGVSGGQSHNELYRRFLYSVGSASESQLHEPEFARVFNGSWEAYIRACDVEEALYAVAIYEILDGPDYGMLLEVLQSCGDNSVDLVFFDVHARAEHVGLFTEYLAETSTAAQRVNWEERAAEFVFGVQEKMWRGLLRGCM
jgi:Iron-containing redox enzyme